MVIFNNANSDKKKLYVRLADRPIKEKYSNHKRALRHEKYENRTELLNVSGDRNAVTSTFQYSVATKVHGNTSSIICLLCLTGKL